LGKRIMLGSMPESDTDDAVRRPSMQRAFLYPTHSNLERRNLTLSLSEEEHANLAEAANRLGVSRGELVRICLSAVLHGPVQVNMAIPSAIAERLMVFRDLSLIGARVRKVIDERAPMAPPPEEDE